MRKKHSEVDESEKRQRHIQEMEEKLKQLAGGETQFGFSASCSDELHAPSLRTPAFGRSYPTQSAMRSWVKWKLPGARES